MAHDGEPGAALPGEGKSAQQEPLPDRLSALINVMNEKFRADLGEADNVWVDQHWVVVKGDDTFALSQRNNDRSQYRPVLEEKIRDLMVERHSQNGVPFDLFFANPDFQVTLVNYLVGTYDEFRREAASGVVLGARRLVAHQSRAARSVRGWGAGLGVGDLEVVT